MTCQAQVKLLRLEMPLLRTWQNSSGNISTVDMEHQ